MTSSIQRTEGTMFLLTMHPQITGHRSRIQVPGGWWRIVKPGVWFATHEQVARRAPLGPR
jgi:hypothetical protein